MVERLLKIEDTEKPMEIVINVNVLKECWNVTNLYTKNKPGAFKLPPLKRLLTRPRIATSAFEHQVGKRINIINHANLRILDIATSNGRIFNLLRLIRGCCTHLVMIQPRSISTAGDHLFYSLRE